MLGWGRTLLNYPTAISNIILEGEYMSNETAVDAYKKSDALSRILVFEVVLPSSDPFDVEDALDTLRQYAAANLVEDFLSPLSYDDACKLLHERSISVER